MNQEQIDALVQTLEGKTDAEVALEKFQVEEQINLLNQQAKPLSQKLQILTAKLRGQLEQQVKKQTPKRTVPEGVTITGKVEKKAKK